MPSVAERELDQHADLIFDILDLRAAADAYRAYASIDGLSAAAKRQVLRNELVQEVRQAEFERVQAEVIRG